MVVLNRKSCVEVSSLSGFLESARLLDDFVVVIETDSQDMLIPVLVYLVKATIVLSLNFFAEMPHIEVTYLYISAL